MESRWNNKNERIQEKIKYNIWENECIEKNLFIREYQDEFRIEGSKIVTW
jgi:hypothetical protein